jgi:hypothetical protein
MKALITALALAALAVTSAVAQPPEAKAIRADAANIYQSDAQGNQTFPDTDRYFDGHNARRMD